MSTLNIFNEKNHMVTFATLGPAGSNHEMVTHQYLSMLALRDWSIELANNFDIAVTLLKEKKVDFLIQCAAHPDVARILGANQGELFVIDTFIAPGKPLGVLSRIEVTNPRSIAFHPATRSYVDLSRWEQKIEAQSTVAVANGLLSNRYDSGITALEVADKYPNRFRIDAVIEAIDDAWLVYGRSRVCHKNGMIAWQDSPGANMIREKAAQEMLTVDE
ncbi:MAG: hypothetical protein AAF614_32370 [Chloroflexota bacterium]